MKRLIASNLTFESDAKEEAFITHVLNEVRLARDKMGVEPTSREYKINSFLWRLDTYQLGYEQNFDWREPINLLFKESNLSMNLPMTPVNQHGDKMCNDLVGSPVFFAPVAEGLEDENPAIDVLMQRLKSRAKEIGLHETAKKATIGALVRGQEVVRMGLSEGYYLKPTLVSNVTLDGKVIKDSRGVPVSSKDVWIADPANPDIQILERDPAVQVPKGAALAISRPKVVMQRVSRDAGTEATIIHYGDFFCDLNAPSLDASAIKGHVFAANAADLMLGYDPDSYEKGAKEYIEAAAKGNLTGGMDGSPYAVRADTFRARDGETEDTTKPADTIEGRYRRRVYADVWIRYDADGDGYAEDIYCLMDVDAQIPVHYEYAAIILPWLQSEHPHPYTVLRIFPKLHRWTGRGFYELLDPFAQFSDKMFNRIEVDSSTSGNVVFENPLATDQGVDGEGIQFRTRTAYTLRPNYTADDAMSVKTVEPSNLEIFNSMLEAMRGRAEIAAGLTSPSEATVTDVPGQDTLGVAKIMENTSNQSLRAREAEIVAGLSDMLNAFISIEVYAVLNTPGGLESLIRQVGEEKAALLVEWLKTKGDEVTDYLEVSLTKAHSSQIIETAEATINVLNQFAAMPPPLQAAMMTEYVNILKGMGNPNPEATLARVQEASRLIAQAQAQAAMEQAQADGQPPQPQPANR